MNEFLEETELVKGLRAEVEKLKRELENRHQLKMYVWTDLSSFLAVAHAKSVKSARELLFTGQYIGESGDGSCPERDRARRIVASENPSIWIGENAEFCLSDSAELREQEAHSDTLFKRASAAEAERDQLKLEIDRLQSTSRFYATIYDRYEALRLKRLNGPERPLSLEPVPSDHVPTLKARIAELEAQLEQANADR